MCRIQPTNRIFNPFVCVLARRLGSINGSPYSQFSAHGITSAGRSKEAAQVKRGYGQASVHGPWLQLARPRWHGQFMLTLFQRDSLARKRFQELQQNKVNRQGQPWKGRVRASTSMESSLVKLVSTGPQRCCWIARCQRGGTSCTRHLTHFA
jgi:hypothetical protein